MNAPKTRQKSGWVTQSGRSNYAWVRDSRVRERTEEEVSLASHELIRRALLNGKGVPNMPGWSVLYHEGRGRERAHEASKIPANYLLRGDFPVEHSGANDILAGFSLLRLAYPLGDNITPRLQRRAGAGRRVCVPSLQASPSLIFMRPRGLLLTSMPIRGELEITAVIRFTPCSISA